MVQENAVRAVEEWNRVIRTTNMDELIKETEKMSEDLAEKRESACSAFRASFENANEHSNTEQTLQVRISGGRVGYSKEERSINKPF